MSNISLSLKLITEGEQLLLLCTSVVLLGLGISLLWFGRNKVTGQYFTREFLNRFGEFDTELVFDKFKKLQTTKAQAYFDEFERCRGQLLMKIPGLTTE